MSLGPLRHRLGCPSREVDALLKVPPRPAMYRKTNILTDGHGAPSSNTNVWGSSATYRTAHSGPHSLPKTTFFTVPLPSIAVEGFSRAPLLVSDFPAQSQDPRTTLSWSNGLYFHGVRFKKHFSPCFLNLRDIRSIIFIDLDSWYIYSESSVYSWHSKMSFESMPWTAELYKRKTDCATCLLSWSQEYASEMEHM